MILLIGTTILSLITLSTQSTTYIQNADDLIDFSESVHQFSRSYQGETIILTSDIDFSTTNRSFYPIGRCLGRDVSSCSSFNGVFQGQGHVISNLQISSQDDIILGIFGYSTGLTISDVILDASNSFTLNAGSVGVFGAAFSYVVGGIVAVCGATSANCEINNCVSMTSIITSGDLQGAGNIVAGGISGVLRPDYHFNCEVRNCISDTNIVLSVLNANESRIGGILGVCKRLEGNDEYDDETAAAGGTCSVRNCIQYGTIVHNEIGGTSSFNVGDIIGEINEQTIVQNCVSLGTFSYLQSFFYNNKGNYGSIAGIVTAGNTTVRECYWARAAPADGPIGKGEENVTMIHVVAFDSNRDLFQEVWGSISLAEVLNKGRFVNISSDFMDDEDEDDESKIFIEDIDEESITLSRWTRLLFYSDGGGTYMPIITLNTHAEHYLGLPVPQKTNSLFNCWCTDISRREPFKNAFLESITTDDAILYARYDITIDDAASFIQFSNSVANGDTFAGTTVYLLSDIDFSMSPSSDDDSSLVPIGRYIDTGNFFPFNGIFNGQGHVLSNLNLTSSDAGVGLFGYSTGGSLLNLVLDSTCQIISTCTLQTYDSSTAGLFSTCFASDRPCEVRRCVTAASVTALGDIGGRRTYLGGVAGLFRAKGYSVGVSDTAVISATVLSYSGSCFCVRVGGIVGVISGEEENTGDVRNCLFEGSIEITPGTLMEASPDESSKVAVGGIAGMMDIGGAISNCAVNLLGLDNVNISEINNSTMTSFGCICAELNGAEKIPALINNSYCTFKPNEIVINNNIYNLSNYYINEKNIYNKVYMTSNTNSDDMNALSNGNIEDPQNAYTKLPLIGIVYNYDNIITNNIAYFNETTGVVLNTTYDGNYVTVPLNANNDADSLKWSLVLLDPLEGRGHSGNVDMKSRLFLGTASARFSETPEAEPPEGYVFGGWYEDKELTTAANLSDLVEKCDTVIWAYAKYLQSIIVTAQDFLHFVETVNSGFNYFNKTILLDSDIDLKGLPFMPIGSNDSYTFSGVFDGQGHVIDGISLSAPLPIIGVFGYSAGATVKNVVIGPNSRLESTTATDVISDVIAAGGIFGICDARDSQCVVESCVVMSDVIYSDITSHLSMDITANLGGIAGIFSANYESVSISNCAVYGNISYNSITSLGNIGGIAGTCKGNTSEERGSHSCTIGNTLFKGRLKFSRNDISGLNVGGILGKLQSNNVLRNCVSDPKSINIINGFDILFGSIAGSADVSSSESSELSNCYWLATTSLSSLDDDDDDDDDAGAEAFGGKSGENGGTFSLSYVLPFKEDYLFEERIISGGVSTKSLITALNSHVASYASKWLIFSFMKKPTSNSKNEEKMFGDLLVLKTNFGKVAPFIIPNPSHLYPDDDSSTFLGWFMEAHDDNGASLGEVLVNFTAVDSGKIVMYPKWDVMSGATATGQFSIFSIVVAAIIVVILC